MPMVDKGGNMIEAVEKEVRERLQQRALLNKSLLKLGDSVQNE